VFRNISVAADIDCAAVRGANIGDQQEREARASDVQSVAFEQPCDRIRWNPGAIVLHLDRQL
jgi:hypothetical protein